MNYKTLLLLSSLTLVISSVFFLNSCTESDTPTTSGQTDPGITDTSTSDGKTDLVITDIYKKPGNPNAIYIKYMNKGNTSQGDQFLISLSSSKGTFKGNANHRFSVPAPNTETETGAYNISLLSLESNETAPITAVIDWEDRSAESDETNNSFTKIVSGY